MTILERSWNGSASQLGSQSEDSVLTQQLQPQNLRLKEPPGDTGRSISTSPSQDVSSRPRPGLEGAHPTFLRSLGERPSRSPLTRSR